MTDLTFPTSTEAATRSSLLDAHYQLQFLAQQVKRIEEPVPGHILRETQRLEERETHLHSALADETPESDHAFGDSREIQVEAKRLASKARSLAHEAEFLAMGPKSSINLLAKLAGKLFGGDERRVA